YQAVLRGELSRRLGVGWTPVRRGTAELDGVPAGLRRLFSRRRAQIEAALEKVGRGDARAAQAATLTTRPGKQAVDPETLREQWASRCLAAGYDPDQLAEVLHRASPPGLPAGPSIADRVLAADGLTRRRSHFTRRDLLRAVCEAIPPGAGVDLDALRRIATEVIRDPRVVALLAEAPPDSRRYSTADLLGVERGALAAAAARRGEQAGMVDPGSVQAALAAGRLCAEQQRAVRSLTTSGAGVELLVGPAGSGKTAALAAARQAWQEAGYRVIGAALAAVAARNLAASAGIASSSLARLLADTARLDPETGRPAGLPARCVLVADEASMIGTRALAGLIELTGAARAKLVLVGDPHQLPEIDAGGLFAALARTELANTLTENQRQQEGWERAALAELRSGDVCAALDAYLAHDRVRTTATGEEARARIVADYLTAGRDSGGGEVLMLASRRFDARRLAELVRDELLAAGALGDTALAVATGRASIEFRTGDQVLVTTNDYRRGLLNGTRARVTEVDPAAGRLTLATTDGQAATLPASWLALGHLQHGYALTCHRAQGLTVDVALLYGTAALCAEAGYVGLSRGRRANRVYASLAGLRRDTDGGIDHLPDPRPAAEVLGELVTAALAERLGASAAQRLALAVAAGRRPPGRAGRPARAGGSERRSRAEANIRAGGRLS
ncbi:MAG: AAA family ATPase, partial [Mycobacteriales bacterium]